MVSFEIISTKTKCVILFFKFFISLHEMVILHCSFASAVFVFKIGYNKTIIFPLYPE